MSEIDELREAIEKLEKRVKKLERELRRSAASSGEEVVFEEDGYMIVRAGLFGEYIVVTPDGREYPYTDLNRAKKVLEMLKSG
jgi:hypothetical protein